MEDKGFELVAHEKPWHYEEDGLKVTRGSAWTGPGCHIGCGVLLYTDENDKLVKVEGDPESPFNEGRLCPRCLALPECTNHDDRLKYPMKRAREDRGKNRWERISWDEAFDTIATKFIDIREEFGPECVAFYQGTGRDIAAWITRLAAGDRVLELLARGRDTDFIHDALFISSHTVKTHCYHLYKKLEVHSQQEIITLVEGCANKKRLLDKKAPING